MTEKIYDREANACTMALCEVISCLCLQACISSLPRSFKRSRILSMTLGTFFFQEKKYLEFILKYKLIYKAKASVIINRSSVQVTANTEDVQHSRMFPILAREAPSRFKLDLSLNVTSEGRRKGSYSRLHISWQEYADDNIRPHPWSVNHWSLQYSQHSVSMTMKKDQYTRTINLET